MQKARCGHSLVVSGRRWSLDGLMMVLCMQLDLGCCTPDWSAIEMNSGVESEVLLEVKAADVTRRWSDPRSSEGRDEVGAASSPRHNTRNLHVNTLQNRSTRRHHEFHRHGQLELYLASNGSEDSAPAFGRTVRPAEWHASTCERRHHQEAMELCRSW